MGKAALRLVSPDPGGPGKAYSFEITTPFKELPERVRDVILNGSGGEKVEFWWEEDGGRRHTYQKEFEGVLNNLERRYRETDRSRSGRSWKST